MVRRLVSRVLLCTTVIVAVECAVARPGSGTLGGGDSPSSAAFRAEPDDVGPTAAPPAAQDLFAQPPGVDTMAPSRPTQIRIGVRSTPSGIDAAVDPITGVRGPDGAWQAIDPPSVARAVWLAQSAEPGRASPGATVLYGHACRGLKCVFDELVHVTVGEAIELDTDAGTFTYEVTRLLDLPKTGPASLASQASVPNELLLVTCAYKADATSPDNLVVVARLVRATRV